MPAWGRLHYTFGGFWEIQPQALEEILERVCIVDVREEAEFNGALGHIRGAHLIPLATLGPRCAELATGKPVVTVCRSGARSAQALVLLQKAGLAEVANLAGGMLRWRAEGYTVQGGIV